MKKTYSLPLLLLLSACTSVGGKYCSSNGFAKGTAAYDQCTMRYEANADLYAYCTTSQGLVQEDAAMHHCIENARAIKSAYQENAQFCTREAETKFGAFLSQPKKEKQPTLHPNGMVTLDDIGVGPYNDAERASYANPFIHECIRAHGWNDPAHWESGQYRVNMKSTMATLSALNKQPIAQTIPVNRIADLFQAVSQGNVFAVRNIITQEGMGVDAQNYQGYSALHVAAKQGNFAIIQMLIEELHATIELRSGRGEDAIAMAAQGPNPSMVSYITGILRQRDIERVRREEQERHRREEEARRLRDEEARKHQEDEARKHQEAAAAQKKTVEEQVKHIVAGETQGKHHP